MSFESLFVVPLFLRRRLELYMVPRIVYHFLNTRLEFMGPLFVDPCLLIARLEFYIVPLCLD